MTFAFKYKKLADIPDLKRGSEEAAGLDVYANIPEDISIGIGLSANIPTGIAVAIPFGFAGLLMPRSGMGGRGLSLRNTIGLIDSDYRGEVIAMVRNLGDATLHIKAHERFAQLVIVPVLMQIPDLVDELPETERGTGGFGSTGA